MSGRVQQGEAVRLDSFATGVLGYPVYELASADEWPLLRERALEEPLMAYAFVAVSDKEKLTWLSKWGWQLVDTNVQMEKMTSRLYQNQPAETMFRLARQQDEDQVAGIARSSFVCSRWHRDSKINNELADKIKEEWARNYWRGRRGQYMVVAEVEGRVVGFNQLIKRDNGVLAIDLIAVNEKYRGKGIASGMIAFAVANCGPMTKMVVGTQLANIASLKMYQRSGFNVVGALHIFHCHLGDEV